MSRCIAQQVVDILMERNMVGVSRRTRPNSADNQQVFSDPRTHESRCILHLEHSANIFLVAQQKNLCYVAEIAAIFDVEKSEDSCSKCLKVMNSGRDFFFPGLRVDLEVLSAITKPIKARFRLPIIQIITTQFRHTATLPKSTFEITILRSTATMMHSWGAVCLTTPQQLKDW